MKLVYRNFNQQELDREYSPSSRVEDINVFLKRYSDDSAAVRKKTAKEFLDLSYGKSADETLDFFEPLTENKGCLQVYIHGGYWQALGKNDSSFAATMFQDHGAAFTAINYSLAPKVSLTDIVEQNRRAIAWLYQNADKLAFDRDKIFLSGSSAGAHLAIMMLLTDWKQYGLPENAIKGVCAVSGIYDLEPIRLTYVNEPLKMDKKEARAMSPVHFKLRNHCPIIIAYGDNETGEFKRQSNEFTQYLKKQKIPAVQHEIPGRNHFDVIMDLASSDTLLSRLVLQQMSLIP